jgi:putative phosphoribosyl transferase
MFQDRIEAGLLLVAKLQKYKDDDAIVLAIPRGGVPVGYTIAKELNLPIEVILTKKIGHPSNQEYAIGAASLTDYFIIPHKEVSAQYVEQEVKKIRTRLKEMYRKFVGDKVPTNLKDKTVIVADDGIATGNTILSTINLLHKSKPKKIILAIPVAAESAIQTLSKEANEIVVLMIPKEFYGVGAFYENFDEVSDDDVIFYLGLKNKKGV